MDSRIPKPSGLQKKLPSSGHLFDFNSMKSKSNVDPSNVDINNKKPLSGKYFILK